MQTPTRCGRNARGVIDQAGQRRYSYGIRGRESRTMTQTTQTGLKEFLAEQARDVDRVLDQWVPGDDTEPVSIHKAMRYSLFAGGKRIRPILAMEAARAISDELTG